MIRIYRVPNKNYPIGEGRNLREAVKDAYKNDELTAYDELYREDENEQIEALEDYVTSARADFIIVGSEE